MKQKHRQPLTALALALLLAFTGACSSGGGGESAPELSRTEGEPFPFPDVKTALTAARAENTEVVGWLYVPGTTINEPVVQGPDNTYYLRRSYKKSYAYSGSLFLDFRADSAALSPNNVIYGHNLGSPMGRRDNPEGEKFAQLLKFLDAQFASEHPYLYYTTESGDYAFQIFSVAYAEAYTRPVEYHHEKYSYAEFSQLVEDLKARSEHNYDIAVRPGDTLLTLSTCTYKYGTYSQNPDQRFVVVGRLVREDEFYTEAAKITPNESPKEPDFSKR